MVMPVERVLKGREPNKETPARLFPRFLLLSFAIDLLKDEQKE